MLRGVVMRGNTINAEYHKMVRVSDKNGVEHVCYEEDLTSQKRVEDEELHSCLDASQIPGTHR
jgi:hypothetical protein